MLGFSFLFHRFPLSVGPSPPAQIRPCIALVKSGVETQDTLSSPAEDCETVGTVRAKVWIFLLSEVQPSSYRWSSFFPCLTIRDRFFFFFAFPPRQKRFRLQRFSILVDTCVC